MIRYDVEKQGWVLSEVGPEEAEALIELGKRYALMLMGYSILSKAEQAYAQMNEEERGAPEQLDLALN